MEQEGLFFLQPVYALLFHNSYLNFPHSDENSIVTVTYKIYYNNYTSIQIDPNHLSIQDAVDQELTPGNIKLKITKM